MKVVRRMMALAGIAVSLATAASRANATDGPARLRNVRFYLSVDLSERRLYVMKGGAEVGSYAIAVGERRHPTPAGPDRIRSTREVSLSAPVLVEIHR